ncbi:MAG: HNH endonuclease [Thioalkalivibrio sp.]|nr:HNH endonuclease [Thioalkalivibrio sp.]
MSRLFIFTAGSGAARAHVRDSIENPIPLELVLEHVDPKQAAAVQEIAASQGGLYAWGAVPGPSNIKTWEKMRPGDHVLAVWDKTFHYYAKVLFKLSNDPLAAAIWGRNDDTGQTLERMYFLSNPAAMNAPLSDYDTWLGKKYQGFTNTSAERIARIEEDFGSVPVFLARMGVPAGQFSLDDIAIGSLEVVISADETDKIVKGEDARRRTIREIAARQGQPAFRRALLAAYGGRCCITGCDVPYALDAAHILPYRGDHSNHVSNGLLLRTDIHTLFDLHLLGIDPSSKQVDLAESIQDSDYGSLHGQHIALPENPSDQPSDELLRHRYADFERS